MIHWGWLILAVMLSASFGAFIMAQFAANGQADRCDECELDYWTKRNWAEQKALLDEDLKRWVARGDASGVGVGDWTDGLGGGLRDLGNVVLQRCDPNLSDLAEEHNLED